MARQFQPPTYLKRRASNGTIYARTKLFGEYISLGVYGSDESYRKFEEVRARFRAGKPGVKPTGPLSVAALAAAWFGHIETAGLYRRQDGSETSEVRSWRLSLAPLLRLHGSDPADTFTPKQLKAVRAAMCSGSWLKDDERASRKPCEICWCRRTVNMRVARIVRLFGWAVSEELVPVAVWQALETVAALPAGDRATHDNPDRGPVSLWDIKETLPCLADVPRAMVLLQLATGMRPSEVCGMRLVDIDRRGTVWVYRPGRHKTARTKVRAIPLGPAAQFILAGRSGEWAFPAPNGGPYRVTSYIDRVREASERAGVPLWSPGRIRKTVATDLQERFGIETARAMLGHAEVSVTLNHYAKGDLAIASKAAAKAG